MKKKTAIFLLLVCSFFGQIVNFYAVNLLLGSVPALTYGVVEPELLAVLPAFSLALDFTMGMFLIGRLYQYPRHKKEYLRVNACLLCIFSAIGLAGSILSGTVLYGSFLAPYPFPGYCLIGAVLHGALLIYSAYSLIFQIKLLPNDPQSHKKTPRLVFRTVFLPILIFIAQNRGGALLWAVTYVHLPTLSMTFPFYLSLLLPYALLFHAELFVFGAYEKKPKSAVRNIVAILVITVLCAAVVFWLGARDTLFISVISPALGLERLATMPIDTILHFILSFVLGIFLLIYSIQKQREYAAENAEVR